MNVTVLPSKDTQGDPAQWQARVDLAAAHRLAVKDGLNEGIFNHFTLGAQKLLLKEITTFLLLSFSGDR